MQTKAQKVELYNSFNIYPNVIDTPEEEIIF